MISHETRDSLDSLASIISILSGTGVLGVLWWVVRNAHRHKEKRGVLHSDGVVKLFEKEVGD